MRIVLPWPDKSLWPNRKAHWAPKSRAAAKYKTWGYIGACAQGARTFAGNSASIAVTFLPPDNRARDLDNMLAAIKSGLDGIRDAIGIDDSKWAISISKGAPVTHGKVIVEVSA